MIHSSQLLLALKKVNHPDLRNLPDQELLKLAKEMQHHLCQEILQSEQLPVIKTTAALAVLQDSMSDSHTLKFSVGDGWIRGDLRSNRPESHPISSANNDPGPKLARVIIRMAEKLLS